LSITEVPLVHTTHGPVRGKRSGAVRVFSGIPFAEAPRGALRFAAPTPPRAWSEPRDCTETAPAAPHRATELGRAIGLATDHQSEDCLTVTVWTPASDRAASRPVMVWIHGGGFEGGSAGNPLADGAALAARGDVVVVSLQYRLGILGFLHLEGAPDNRGLLDQVAALEWVRDNIARFGGDPKKVTLFGSSAGGVSVSLLLAMARTRGLFARAIVQSGSPECLHPPETARTIAAEVIEALGLEPDGARASLETMDIEELCEKQRGASSRLAARIAGVVFQPVLDPSMFPEHPLAMIRKGAAAGVALLVGTNKDEMKLAALEKFDFGSPSDDELTTRVRGMLGVEGPPIHEHVLRTYRGMPHLAGASNKDIWDAITTDFYFRYPAIRLADAHARHEPDTFMYTVTLASGAFDGLLGACHAIEIPLVFGTYEVSPMDMFLADTPELPAVSRRVQDVWLAFARHGVPGTDETGSWTRWARGRRGAMLLGHTSERVESAYGAECGLWNLLWSELRPVQGYDGDGSSVLPPPRTSSIFPLPL
jgi:para-nitrobenzyl esterase